MPSPYNVAPVEGVFDPVSGNLLGVVEQRGSGRTMKKLPALDSNGALIDPATGAPVSGGGTLPVGISGTAGAGNLLTAVLATGWTATGYQWTRDGVDIGGATSSTYLQQVADRTHTISVRAVGLSYAGGAVVPPNPSTYVGQVAGQCTIPRSSSGTSTQLIARTRHWLRAGVNYVRVAFPNVICADNSGGLETSLGTTASVSAYLIAGGTNSAGAISGGGTPVQVTWGGASSVTLADKSVDQLSDVIVITAAKDTVLWSQCSYENAAGIIYDVGASGTEALDSTNGEILRIAASGLDLSQINSKAAWTGGTSTTNHRYGPILIVSDTIEPAVLVAGTSISVGTSESAKGTPGAPAASGEIGDRGIVARSIGGVFAYTKIAQGGSRLAHFLVEANRTVRMRLAPYFSHVIIDGPTNDLGGGGYTPAQVVASMQAFAALFPGKVIFGGTVLPRTTGAWTAADGSDQTTSTINNWATNEPALNALIRAGVTGYAGYFDYNAAARLGSNELRWHADGSTAALMTADGLHPSTYGSQRVRSQGVVNTAVILR